MARTILITGGARSGKSRFAEEVTVSMTGRAVYIATAEAGDAEMADRIARHRARRDGAWETLEAPRDLLGALRETDGDRPRLVDCLTLWLSNLMLAEADWEGAVLDLAAGLPALAAPVVFVTNEVGWGIVPENALARRYRDAAGRMNQEIAAAADEVHLVAAGCALRLKPAVG